MTTKRARAWRLAGIAGILVLTLGLLAACGGDDDDEPVGDHDMSTMTTDAEPAPAPTGEGEVNGAPAPAPPAGAGETTVVDIPAADEGMAFEVTEVTVPAGTVTLRSLNPQDMPHNIAMRDPQVREGQIVGQGGVSEITVELEPGTYQFYCSVPGHEAAGMVGTITVT